MMVSNISQKNTFLGSQIFQHSFSKIKTYVKCLNIINAYAYMLLEYVCHALKPHKRPLNIILPK